MIPINPILKMTKKTGFRASSDAIDELRYFADEFAKKLARNAVDVSRFSQRNTVMKKDVEFAYKRMVMK